MKTCGNCPAYDCEDCPLAITVTMAEPPKPEPKPGSCLHDWYYDGRHTVCGKCKEVYGV